MPMALVSSTSLSVTSAYPTVDPCSCGVNCARVGAFTHPLGSILLAVVHRGSSVYRGVSVADLVTSLFMFVLC